MALIKQVKSSKELKAFVDFPHTLFEHDKNYVPELFIAQKDLLSPGKHPFHDHSKIQLFLAYEGDKVVGRIAAIHNANYNTFNKTNEGFFGFFDVVDNYTVAEQLLNEAFLWLKGEGFEKILGPVNFSTNETCGLLIEGYDSPPVMMMTYNKPYYADFLEKFGFTKNVDLLAYLIESHDFKDKAVRLMDLFEERLKNKHITIRKANLKEFNKEIIGIQDVYNTAWDKNLGFVPMTDAEFKYMAKDMKMILDPDFCLVAEHEGKAIGFALCIPDLNEVLIKVKRGRLLPFGIFKLLFGRKKIKRLRVIALGVKEGYRKLGIEACFYGRIILSGLEKGYTSAEASWILENNDMMNQAVKNINGKPYKTYRIYEKAV
jgi:hypothetical protein